MRMPSSVLLPTTSESLWRRLPEPPAVSLKRKTSLASRRVMGWRSLSIMMRVGQIGWFEIY